MIPADDQPSVPADNDEQTAALLAAALDPVELEPVVRRTLLARILSRVAASRHKPTHPPEDEPS